MIYISHRGNTIGPNTDKENNPLYVEEALVLTDVEVDVWLINDTFFLGHDEPKYNVTYDFIRQKGLWLHCKNIAALSVLISDIRCNCFFHNNDDVVLTSSGYLWTYPGKELYSNSIGVLPEVVGLDSYEYFHAAGICSDYVRRYI